MYDVPNDNHLQTFKWIAANVSSKSHYRHSKRLYAFKFNLNTWAAFIKNCYTYSKNKHFLIPHVLDQS